MIERERVCEREGGRERGEGKTVTGYLKCPQNEWCFYIIFRKQWRPIDIFSLDSSVKISSARKKYMTEKNIAHIKIS